MVNLNTELVVSADQSSQVSLNRCKEKKKKATKVNILQCMGRWQLLSNKIFCSPGGRPFVNKPFENPFLRDLIKYTRTTFHCRNYYSLGQEKWLAVGINGRFLGFLALSCSHLHFFNMKWNNFLWESCTWFLALMRHVCVLYFIYLYSVMSIILVVLVSVSIVWVLCVCSFFSGYQKVFRSSKIH